MCDSGCPCMASLAAVMASEMIANIWRAGVDFRSTSRVPTAPRVRGGGGSDVLIMCRSCADLLATSVHNKNAHRAFASSTFSAAGSSNGGTFITLLYLSNRRGGKPTCATNLHLPAG